MKITDYILTKIEQLKKVLVVQSSFKDLAYAVSKFDKTVWLIDRRTGAQIEISAENVYAFAFELMDIADIYLPAKNLFKRGA